MAQLQKTITEHWKPGITGAHDRHTQRVATKLGPYIRRLLTMSLAMGAGIVLFQLLVRLIPASSNYGALFERGTDMYSIGMAIFMTVPTWLAAQCGDAGRNPRTNIGC